MGIEETLYYYNFGVGVTGSNFIPLQKFDILLTEKRIWECLKRYTQNAGEEIQEIVKGIYDHFLVDCIGRWQHNLPARRCIRRVPAFSGCMGDTGSNQ